MSLGERLREERKRKNLDQAAFAELGGVKALAQRNYETGKRSPDAKYLIALLEHGIDVQYLLTGTPMVKEAAIEKELAALSDAWEAIDWALAEAKKTLPPEKKRKAAEALYMAVKTGEGQAKPLARLVSMAA
ncbi:helix-turn-helix domain-containing protein [Alcaligenes sp. 13f]|uniref:helix-turn-helix domain-containing protein n=1 Tax=Alcaligenes sp. 13f TaxID=2841924 RepID=UPI001CF6E8A3|nr:helix-turn-helix transcriptional regulator [Alcaligenes sp. 13f]MCB4324321.1 helix-turn-helix domain-containing protein [Alcaligenes sp. 13f]